jgi:hypothetical protein
MSGEVIFMIPQRMTKPASARVNHRPKPGVLTDLITLPYFRGHREPRNYSPFVDRASFWLAAIRQEHRKDRNIEVDTPLLNLILLDRVPECNAQKPSLDLE